MEFKTEAHVNQRIEQLLEQKNPHVLRSVGSPQGFPLGDLRICIYCSDSSYMWHYHMYDSNFELQYCTGFYQIEPEEEESEEQD